jgi:hypothetical protein
LSSSSRDQLCGPLAICFGIGFLLCLFNGGLFDFGCSSVVREMSFVDYYLPYFMQWPMIHTLLACLPFQSLFTVSSHGNHLLALPPLLWCSGLLAHLPFQLLFTECSPRDQFLVLPPISSAAAYLPVFLSSLCLLKVHTKISSLSFPPSPVHSDHPSPSTMCSFSVPCLLFSFFFSF